MMPGKLTARESLILKVAVCSVLFAIIFNLIVKFAPKNLFGLDEQIASGEYILANAGKLDGLLSGGTHDQLFSAMSHSAAKQSGLTVVKMSERKGGVSSRVVAMEVEVNGTFSQVFTFMTDTLAALPQARVSAYRLNALPGQGGRVGCVMVFILG